MKPSIFRLTSHSWSFVRPLLSGLLSGRPFCPAFLFRPADPRLASAETEGNGRIYRGKDCECLRFPAADPVVSESPPKIARTPAPG